MSNRATPETDAALDVSFGTIKDMGDRRITKLARLSILSRTLERQRDCAVALLLSGQSMLETSDGYGVRNPGATQGRTWLLAVSAFFATLERK